MRTEIKNVVYRQAMGSDLAGLLALSQSMNWPHRRQDWSTLLELGAGWVAVHEGTVVGSALYWHQGVAHATIGLVIVERAWQGHGIGRGVMQRALASCDGRAVMLHATREGAPLYERLGFKAAHIARQHQLADFRRTAQQGDVGPTVQQGDTGAHLSVSGSTPPADTIIRPMTAADHDTLIALYSQAAGVDKRQMLSPFLRSGQGNVMIQGHSITGFSLFRTYGRGQHIGPIVASGLACATRLAEYWMLTDTPMFLRVDSCDDAFSGWLSAVGLPEVDSVQCMWRPYATPVLRAPQPVGGKNATLFALLNQALG